MIKPLLTQQDIKNFILAETNKIIARPDIYLVRKVLCRRLNISEYMFVHNYEHNGLKPAFIKGKRKFYNINSVIKWLDEHNISYVVQNILN